MYKFIIIYKLKYLIKNVHIKIIIIFTLRIIMEYNSIYYIIHYFLITYVGLTFL